MTVTKKQKKVAPKVDLKVEPAVAPADVVAEAAAVDPLERLRVAVLTRLAQKFEGRGKITTTDLTAAVQLLKKAGSPQADGHEVPGELPPAPQDLELSHAPTSTPQGGSGELKGSWSPMDSHERAAVDLPFLPFGEDGKPAAR